MPRAATDYRAARRARAKAQGKSWRELSRAQVAARREVVESNDPRQYAELVRRERVWSR